MLNNICEKNPKKSPSPLNLAEDFLLNELFLLASKRFLFLPELSQKEQVKKKSYWEWNSIIFKEK